MSAGTLALPGPEGSALQSRAASRVAAALLTLLGAVLMWVGTAWDVQWHMRVGRDSFWIPPHIVLYSGLALVGLACGLLLLREIWRPAPGALQLAGLRLAPGTLVTLAGFGLMLVGAAFDDLWHRQFGLDVTVWSPPHLLLIASAVLIDLGALLALVLELRRGSLSGRARRWAWLGLLAGFGLFCGPFMLLLQPASVESFLLPGSQHPFLYPLLAALALPPALGAARASTGHPWAASLATLAASALGLLSFGFGVLGFRLLFPDGLPRTGMSIVEQLGIDDQPLSRITPLVLPGLHILPALALDWLASRGRGWRWRALSAAAWAAVLMGEALLLWAYARDDVPLGQALLLLPPMALLAGVCLWFGGRLGTRLALEHEQRV